MTRLRGVASLVPLLVLSCARKDSLAEMRELKASIAAAEASRIAFEDSVRGKAEASVEQPLDRLPELADACSDPGFTTEMKRYTTNLVSIYLPIDFEPKNPNASERQAARQGYAKYEWQAPDGSKVIIDDSDGVHRGWGGLIKSECNTRIAGYDAHVDVVNHSISLPDLMVVADVKSTNRSLVFFGHARTKQRHNELLHAVRTLEIRPMWGVSP